MHGFAFLHCGEAVDVVLSVEVDFGVDAFVEVVEQVFVVADGGDDLVGVFADDVVFGFADDGFHLFVEKVDGLVGVGKKDGVGYFVDDEFAFLVVEFDFFEVFDEFGVAEHEG